MKRNEKLDLIREASTYDEQFSNDYIIDEADAYANGVEEAIKSLRGKRIQEILPIAKEIVKRTREEEGKEE